jgi:hypothetical protein
VSGSASRIRSAKAYRASAPLPCRRSTLGGSVHGGSWGAASRQDPKAIRSGWSPRGVRMVLAGNDGPSGPASGHTGSPSSSTRYS